MHSAVARCFVSLSLPRVLVPVVLLQSTIVSPAFLCRSFFSACVLLNMSSNTDKNAVLQVKFLSENATMPTKGSPLSAGFDLSSAVDTVIKANSRGIVKTDLSIACPPGTYARIAPRSGLAVKKGIDVGAGVVDADYRGPVGVVLFNFGEDDFVVQKGDRVAQLILEQVLMVPAVKVEELDDTERGAAGFGSTGVSNTPTKKPRTISPAGNEKKSVDAPSDPPATGPSDSPVQN